MCRALCLQPAAQSFLLKVLTESFPPAGVRFKNQSLPDVVTVETPFRTSGRRESSRCVPRVEGEASPVVGVVIEG